MKHLSHVRKKKGTCPKIRYLGSLTLKKKIVLTVSEVRRRVTVSKVRSTSVDPTLLVHRLEDCNVGPGRFIEGNENLSEFLVL